jgi:hypothetical protein
MNEGNFTVKNNDGGQLTIIALNGEISALIWSRYGYREFPGDHVLSIMP